MAGFRKRYDDLEQRRVRLIERLSCLDERARAHPGYRGASTLLNWTFRRARIAQRLAILQAAEWMINVLETWTAIT